MEPIDDFEYKAAQDLEYAWLNFELDLPLPPEPGGRPNPFYVDRPGNPVERLEQELLLPYSRNRPPKYFFSGHRGCGKSTELRRIAANPKINKKYWPVHFSIRNLADVNNLDFKDVLLAIGGQLYLQYQERSRRKLPAQLLKELDSWRGDISQQVTTILAGRMEGEVEAKLSGFFAELGSKIKLEPKTRDEIHRHIEPNITGLVRVINDITATITAQEKKPPLVLIDDLDKPDLSIAKAIFHDRREIMLQPLCPIVYTVSSPLFYSMEFRAVRDQNFFLPNVKLHPQGKLTERDADGYYTLRMLVHKRMEPSLITDEALDLAAEMSGGVFRELARVMRGAIGRALSANRTQIGLEDVRGAAAEIRRDYWRVLTAEHRALLQEVRQHNQMKDPDKLAPLLQILAVLEYNNGDTWCDVHPALRELLD